MPRRSAAAPSAAPPPPATGRLADPRSGRAGASPLVIKGDRGGINRPLRTGSWALLAVLLGITLIGAWCYDRSGWPALVAGEATPLMQAESLIRDFDLVYTRADYDRLLLGWHGNPTDLELTSGSAGRRMTFDRPFPYALWLVPFLLLWPDHGFAVANAVVLALAALAAARTLERLGVELGALWIAVLVFGSVSFSYVFLATGDLFLLAAAVGAFCFVARAQPAPAGRPPDRLGPRGWFVAGLLLALVLAGEPLAGLALVAAAWFAAPRQARFVATRGPLLLALVIGLLGQIGVQWWAGGGLHFVATTSFRFTPETGFPLVDFTAAEWTPMLHRLQALYWEEAPRFSWGVDLRLWLWDLLYLLVGRSIGLVPYFAPLVMVVAGASFRGFRRAIAIAAGGWLVAIIVLHPFNLYGGEGAVGNRLFLPLYGALWLVVARRRGLWTLPLVAVVAASFLWRLWTAPWSDPIDPAGGYRYVTATASRLLPWETSQRRIPAGQVADHSNLKVRFLNAAAWAETRPDRLAIDGAARADLVVVSSRPLAALRLDFGPDAPSRIAIRGGRLGETVMRAGGAITFRIVPRWPARRHPLWRTPQAQYLYCLSLELPGAEGTLRLRMVGEWKPSPTDPPASPSEDKGRRPRPTPRQGSIGQGSGEP